jgi:hypothetical protein
MSCSLDTGVGCIEAEWIDVKMSNEKVRKELAACSMLIADIT